MKGHDLALQLRILSFDLCCKGHWLPTKELQHPTLFSKKKLGQPRLFDEHVLHCNLFSQRRWRTKGTSQRLPRVMCNSQGLLNGSRVNIFNFEHEVWPSTCQSVKEFTLSSCHNLKTIFRIYFVNFFSEWQGASLTRHQLKLQGKNGIIPAQHPNIIKVKLPIHDRFKFENVVEEKKSSQNSSALFSYLTLFSKVEPYVQQDIWNGRYRWSRNPAI